MRDRIELHRWSSRASAFGISRVLLEPAEPGDAPGMGEFLLVYVDGDEWARWGVAPREDGRVEVWSMIDSSSLGTYPTLVEALEQILAV